MPRIRLMSCSVLLPLALASCSSPPHAQPPAPPAPPAWLMQPGPDLLTPLSGIISVSESESKPPAAK